MGVKKRRPRRDVISGVYQIACIETGKVYIGSSKDIFTRWVIHKYGLRKKIHHNKYLQNAWDKYGEDSFLFSILEESPIDSLFDVEQKWYSKTKCWDENFGYNLSKISKSPSRPATMDDILSGKQSVSPEQFKTVIDLLCNTDTPLTDVAKISNTPLSTVNSIFYRENYSDVTKNLVFRDRIIGVAVRKMSNDDIESIIKMLSMGCCPKLISKYFDLSVSSIVDIRCGYTYKAETEGIVFPKSSIFDIPDVEMYDMQGNLLKTYSSTTHAGKDLGVSHKQIWRVCVGKRNSTHGKVFKYKNTDLKNCLIEAGLHLVPI